MWKPKYFHVITRNSEYRTVSRVGEPGRAEVAQADQPRIVVGQAPVGREDHA